MIKIYFNKGQDKILRKTIEWFGSHYLQFELLPRQELNRQHLKYILSMSDNGFEDILVSECRAQRTYSSLDFEYEKFSTEEMIDFILCHQNILRAPIIFDKKHLCVGYDSESLREFVKKRKIKKKTWY